MLDHEQQGLSMKQAKEVLKKDGPNELEKPSRPSAMLLFVAGLTHGDQILLAVFALLAASLSPATSVAIFALVVVRACVEVLLAMMASSALQQRLSAELATTTTVVRGGEVVIPPRELVRGDIVVLGAGDLAFADLRLVEARGIAVDESPLTGDPGPVAKTSQLPSGTHVRLLPQNMVFSGCAVLSGTARGLVVDTGRSTRIGRIIELIGGSEEKKKRCGCLPDNTAEWPYIDESMTQGSEHSVLGVALCLVALAVGVFRRCCFGGDKGFPPSSARRGAEEESPIWPCVVLVAVLVGLPRCLLEGAVLSLSAGCAELARKGMLLQRVKAMGMSRITVILATTPSILEGRMMAKEFFLFVGGKSFGMRGSGTAGLRCEGSLDEAGHSLAARSALFAVLLSCSSVVGGRRGRRDPDTGEEGDAWEGPVMAAAREVGLERPATKWRSVLEIPSTPDRKMMLTLTEVPAGEDGLLCDGGMALPQGTTLLSVVTGAPEFVLGRCVEQLLPDGRSRLLTAEERTSILEEVDVPASRALRVLAIAAQALASPPFEEKGEEVAETTKFDACSNSLRFLGFVAFVDPCRDVVDVAVQAARRVGIRTIMVTGHHLKSAIAVARKAEILTPEVDESRSACGGRREPDYSTGFQHAEVAACVCVLARVKGREDRLEIVKSLQRQGEVCAWVGGGLADVGALAQAHVGVGLGASEVAKNADVVLTSEKNSVGSLVAAVVTCRAVRSRTQRLHVFALAATWLQVLQTSFCLVVGLPVIRTVAQILLLAVVIERPAQLALAVAELDDSAKQEQPPCYGSQSFFPHKRVLLDSLILSLITVVIYAVALARSCEGEVFQSEILSMGDASGCLKKARTVAFLTVAWSEGALSCALCSTWAATFQVTALTQAALALAVLLPHLSDAVLQLDGWAIGLEGLCLALVGPAVCMPLLELVRTVAASSKGQQQADALSAPLLSSQ